MRLSILVTSNRLESSQQSTARAGRLKRVVSLHHSSTRDRNRPVLRSSTERNEENGRGLHSWRSVNFMVASKFCVPNLAATLTMADAVERSVRTWMLTQQEQEIEYISKGSRCRPLNLKLANHERQRFKARRHRS